MNNDGREALWSSEELAMASGGTVMAPFKAMGVSIDSRTVRPGDLFVAIVGPNHDGHDHVAEALALGASGAFVHRQPKALGDGAPLVMVSDTFDALGAVACAARRRGNAEVIAVTGSVGKTGTKDALRLVLGRQKLTIASQGNLNNHWGLPLSLARMSRDAHYGVFEMGMNHVGEIHPLSLMAQPDVAVITNVESVHRAHFRDEDDIAQAKAEVFDGMGADGVAILNRDNRHFGLLALAAQQRCIGRTISFGTDTMADVHSLAVSPGVDGTQARLSVLGQELTCHIGIAGHHWLMNAMAVLAVVVSIGADVPAAAAALKDLRPSTGRGSRQYVAVNDGRFTLIDDSYNASPISMRAAIAVLGDATPGPCGRRIAVLGDMLELGPDSPVLHAELASVIEAAGVDQVFTAGTEMAQLAKILPASRRGFHAASAEALAPLVATAVQKDDVVMVKGSRGSRMRLIVEALGALGAGEGEVPRRMANGG
jgi:UDP-N-acetylmuramoyl-tripeptide--D-alanyl-D-alanine ligase